MADLRATADTVPDWHRVARNPAHRVTVRAAFFVLVLGCSLALGTEPVGAAPTAESVSTIDPSRVLDTRSTGNTVDGQAERGGRVGAGKVVKVRVAGRGGIPADAPAAIVNVAAVRPASKGYATLYPCTSQPPNASTLNFEAGTNLANATTVKLSNTGDLCIYTSATTDFILDATGYIPVNSDVSTIDPSRVLDTRSTGNTVDGQAERGGRVGAGKVVKVRRGGPRRYPRRCSRRHRECCSRSARQQGLRHSVPLHEPAAERLNAELRGRNQPRETQPPSNSPTQATCAYTHQQQPTSSSTPPGTSQ